MEQTPFGKYTLTQVLGQGGMARVYKAIQTGIMGFRKEVAIKQILPEAAEDERLIKSLINEARLGGLLRHPNVVEIYEFDKVDAIYYMALEYVNGPTLDAVIDGLAKKKERLPTHITIDILLQICDGLAYAHSAQDETGCPMNLVHRDLKPANIIMSRAGVAKVMDFGIARAETNVFKTTSADTTKGTPVYMSPEQVRGGALDARSDLFSLTSVMGEMVLGHVVFHGTQLFAVLQSIVSCETEPKLEEIQQIAPELLPVFQRGWAKDPDERYQDAEEFKADLVEIRKTWSEPNGYIPYLKEHGFLAEVSTGNVPTMATPATSQPTLQPPIPPLGSGESEDEATVLVPSASSASAPTIAAPVSNPAAPQLSPDWQTASLPADFDAPRSSSSSKGLLLGLLAVAAIAIGVLGFVLLKGGSKPPAADPPLLAQVDGAEAVLPNEAPAPGDEPPLENAANSEPAQPAQGKNVKKGRENHPPKAVEEPVAVRVVEQNHKTVVEQPSAHDPTRTEIQEVSTAPSGTAVTEIPTEILSKVNSPSPRTRSEGLQQMAAFNSPAVLAAVRNALKNDPLPMVREAALDVCKQKGGRTYMKLVSDSYSTESAPSLRLKAISILRAKGGSRAKSIFAKAINDSDGKVRKAAAEALVRIARASDRAILEACAASADGGVAAVCSAGLAKL